MRLFYLYLAMIGVVLPHAARAEGATLEQAWAQAYQFNPSLQAARAGVRATDERVAEARSHWRPSIDATANIGRTWQRIPGQNGAGQTDYAGTARGYGVQVTQPLFRGFRTLAETEAAEKQVQAERAKLTDAEQTLFLDTATAFLDILRDQSILDIEKRNEEVLQQKLKETKERAKYGELTHTDIHQAESRLARTRVGKAQAARVLSQSRAAYLRLTGKEPGILQAPSLAAADAAQREHLLLNAEKQNPKIIAAKYSLEQSDAEVDLNKGGLLPEVNLVGNAGRNWDQSYALPGRTDQGQVMVQMTVPLYRSGADYARIRAAEQTVTQKRMELEEARHVLHETSGNAWQDYLAAKEALEADQEVVEASARALKGVKEESKAGTRTTLDVLNAEQELLDAKIDQARAQRDRDLALLRIQASAGLLTAENLKLHVEGYDPARHYDDARGAWIGFSKDDARYGVPPQSRDVP